MIHRMTRGRIATSLLTAILVLAGSSYCQEQATILSIVDVLRSGHLSGSLEYRGSCYGQDDYLTRRFPITTTPTSHSAPPLQILREMFAKDEDMLVTQEPDGTVRMVEKAVPKELLNVKIEHLSFDDEQKKDGPIFSFSPPAVLWLITHTPEVESFMKGHNIGREPRIVNEATTTKPHVSGELNNVTLSQALDYMAKTFRGLWVYKECPGDKKPEGNDRIV
jgi:hypothetical protein